MVKAIPVGEREMAISVRLLTINQLCAELQVCRATVLLWRQAGMPSVPLGPYTVRFNLLEVLQWLEKRAEASRAS